VSLRDVTRHKLNEQALRDAQTLIARSEEQVRLILDSAAEGILVAILTAHVSSAIKRSFACSVTTSPLNC